MNGILYSNRSSFLIQERGSEQGMILLENTSKSAQDYVTKFPLISPDYMLLQLYDEGDYYEQQKNCIKLYIAPPINSKTIKISDDIYGESKQYFLYSDDNYVIDIEKYGASDATIKLNSKTGYTYDTKMVRNQVDYMNKNYGILSRNGKYLLYVAFADDKKEITTRLVSIDKEQDNKGSDIPDTGDSKSSKEDMKKKEDEKEKEDKEDKENENEKESDPDNVQTKTTPKLAIEELGETKLAYDIDKIKDIDDTDKCYPKWRITDKKDIICISFYFEIFYINGVNHFETIRAGLQKSFKKIPPEKQATMPVHNRDIYLGDSFVIIKIKHKFVYFRFDAKTGKISKLKKLKHKVVEEYEGITFVGIILSSHPDYIIFRYLFQDDSQNFMIWDLQSNSEVSSFFSNPTDSFKGFIHGDTEAVQKEMAEKAKLAKFRGKRKQLIASREVYTMSRIGYLMFENFFVNLETCVPSPLMKFSASGIDEDDFDTGMKMSTDERFVLADKKLLTSFSYMDIEFKSKREEYTIAQPDVFKYFIDRKSVFFDYVQDPDKLKEFIQLFSAEPIYYTLIITPNKDNVSPLDVSIENNSIKVVELFLKELSKITDYNLSKAFYKKFDKLFEMDIDAFRDFIDICYIQSGQMRMMDKLPIKLDGFSLASLYSKKLRISGDNSILTKTNCSIMTGHFNKDFNLKKIEKEEDKGKEEEDKADKSESDKEDNVDIEDDKSDDSLVSEFSINDLDHQEDKPFFLKNIEKDLNKKVNVKLIEFDWVLKTKEGESFLQNLANTKNHSYFDVEVIQYIIKFQWAYYLPRIVVALFVPFLVHFLLFIIYTTYVMHEKHLDYNPDCTEPCTSDDKFGEWYTADFVLGIMVLVFQMFFLYIEVHQVSYHRLQYFTSFWNLLDVCSIVLNVTTVLVDILDGKEKDANAIASIAVLVLWFRFFYLLRVFSETAYLVSMVEAIIVDMRYFVLALLMAIIAFANTFFILGRNSDGSNFAGDTVFLAFIFSYKMGLGDFDTDGFGTDDEILIWILWFLNTISIAIIMLNLVIAIMGDIFGRVQETRKATMLQEFTSIMRENDFLFDRNSIFKKVKYIVIIDPEKAEGANQSDWEGRVNQLKRFLDESSKKHIVDLNKMALKQQKFISSAIERKLKPSQNKIKQKITNLEHRIQKSLDILSQYLPDKSKAFIE